MIGHHGAESTWHALGCVQARPIAVSWILSREIFMDHHAQHHQHHEKEREEKIKHEKERESDEENQIRKMHPAWFVALGVVLIFTVVCFWIWAAS